MWDVVIGAGGGAGIAGMAAWVIVQFAKMRAERPGPVFDAATANQALSSALDQLQEENGRLGKRVESLEIQLTARDDKIVALEERLRSAEWELRSVREALSELKEH